VANIIVAAPLDLSEAHGQKRLAPVKRLDLTLLVNAKHDSAFGRRNVETNDVAHLLDK
jgi:hypothetical protein